jgi:hypothetical protein
MHVRTCLCRAQGKTLGTFGVSTQILMYSNENKVWKPQGVFARPDSYTMFIMDRWGQEVFRTMILMKVGTEPLVAKMLQWEHTPITSSTEVLKTCLLKSAETSRLLY